MPRQLLAILLLTLCLSTSYATRRIVVAYVGSGAEAMPNPRKMTHINYAFGTVNATFDGVEIQNPERLRAIAGLKKLNPGLHVLLSIGGWGAGGFSEMASNATTRRAFVKHCEEIVRDFKIDGIDLDWEYPGVSWAGIAAKPEDTGNFTLLIQELRRALGKKKLLTFASAASARHVDFPAVLPCVDFINLMTYDMGRPHHGGHHSALYPSNKAQMSVESSVLAHLGAGVPKEKIVIGVPFYAHANTQRGYNDFEDNTKIDSIFAGHRFEWDPIARVPYVADSADGTLLCVYDNERSIGIKCEYVHNHELLGMMYWLYGADGPQGELSDAVWRGIFCPESNARMLRKMTKLEKKN